MFNFGGGALAFWKSLDDMVVSSQSAGRRSVETQGGEGRPAYPVSVCGYAGLELGPSKGAGAGCELNLKCVGDLNSTSSFTNPTALLGSFRDRPLYRDRLHHTWWHAPRQLLLGTCLEP